MDARRSPGGRWAALLFLAAGLAPALRAQDGRVLREEASASEQVYGRVLARDLGVTLGRVEGVVHQGRLPDGKRLEGRGPHVVLDGVGVTRLLFRHPAEAGAYVEELLEPGRVPVVAELRGRQVVVLRGPRLTSASLAARVLGAAWAGEVLDAPEGVELELLRVGSPLVYEGALAAVPFDAATLIGSPETASYRDMLERLRAARAHAEDPDSDLAPEFLSTNHFTLAAATERGTTFSEVLLTREGALAAVGEDAERCRAVLRYARGVLEGLEGPLDGPRRHLLDMIHAVLVRTEVEGGEGDGGEGG